jgi:hypothetical protein
MTSRTCARCKAETETTLVDVATGEAKPLAIAIHGMPVLACPKGHRQFVDSEFPRWLLEHLLKEDEARLPAGKETGMIFKHFNCSECGAELAPQPDHRHTFTADVSLQDLAPFKVELTMPVYRCQKCEKEQIHSLKEVWKHTPEALAHAFQAAEIPPA